MKKENNLKRCVFQFIMTIITFIIGFGFFYLGKNDPINLKLKVINILCNNKNEFFKSSSHEILSFDDDFDKVNGIIRIY